MKPAPFAYVRARTAVEAVQLLRAHDGNARLLAGGQSLMPMLSMRLVRPSVVIDINRIPGLSGIDEMLDGVRIGPLTRYSAIEHSSVVARRLPLLSEAMRFVGDRQIRNRGTIGGSLAHGDPSGEAPLVGMTLGATVTIRGPDAVRDVAVEDLYIGPYATVLEADEMIVDVRFPDRSGALSVLLEHVRRHGDFAVLAVAAFGVPDDGEGWREVRLGLSGLGPRPILVPGIGAALAGRKFEPAALSAVKAACAEVVDPGSDVRASAEYRRHLMPIYVERALAELEGRRKDVHA